MKAILFPLVADCFPSQQHQVFETYLSDADDPGADVFLHRMDAVIRTHAALDVAHYDVRKFMANGMLSVRAIWVGWVRKLEQSLIFSIDQYHNQV